MTNENQRTFSIPRWHYRDTRAEVQSILESANSTGSLRGAMVDYLNKRQDKLPEGMTAESAADAIVNAADGFAAAHAARPTADDIKKALKDAIREMTSQQAVAYLAALEAVCRLCDSAATGGDVPSTETLKGELTAAAGGATEEEVAGRIERLAETILGDSLKSYVYASGNGELAALVQAQPGIASDGISTATASRIHEMLLDDSRKARLYAATACACYGMVLDGGIEGMSASNLDAGVMTALVAAGLEKASILTRLMRGEIDRELAMDMLGALANTLKWMLVKAMQGSIFLTVGSIALFGIGVTFSILGCSLPVWALLALGCMIGLSYAMDSKDDLESLVDFLGVLTKMAFDGACGAASWCLEKGRQLIGNAASARTDIQRSASGTAKATN